MKLLDLLSEGRVGEVVIDSEIANTEEFDNLAKVMEKIFVTRCEHQYVSDTFVYTALSPEFRKTDVGEVPPRYDVVVDTEDGEFVDVRFEERKL